MRTEQSGKRLGVFLASTFAICLLAILARFLITGSGVERMGGSALDAILLGILPGIAAVLAIVLFVGVRLSLHTRALRRARRDAAVVAPTVLRADDVDSFSRLVGKPVKAGYVHIVGTRDGVEFWKNSKEMLGAIQGAEFRAKPASTLYGTHHALDIRAGQIQTTLSAVREGLAFYSGLLPESEVRALARTLTSADASGADA